jgi:hypothetical protein
MEKLGSGLCRLLERLRGCRDIAALDVDNTGCATNSYNAMLGKLDAELELGGATSYQIVNKRTVVVVYSAISDKT